MVSIWELQIKQHLGKIQLARPLEDTIDEQMRSNDIQVLPVVIEHVFGLGLLPDIHKDPFDRLLVSQAQIEGAILISNDPLIAR